MSYTQIPPKSTLHDAQFITIEGPDGITTGYFYDKQQNALYFKESQLLFPAKHGFTHIFEDPVPDASCDAHGLMSADDKCKMDALDQTRVGVLGFMGAGFPDDGGWMQGDIILAAGTEFIQLERIGNVIRFTVDSPIPLNCACEACNQIFWVQDETDIVAIRPPTCSGKLPGVNDYGEFKVFLFPEATLVDPANPTLTLSQKNKYPAFLFRRYLNSITPGKGMIEWVLVRNAVNTQQTQVGFVMTPGPDQGKVECQFFMGLDDQGNLTKFRLDMKHESGLLGEILYKGHLITKQMAVIIDFTPNTITANQYKCRLWDVLNGEPVGDSFIATNLWRYQNPEAPDVTTANPKTLILDQTQDILPVGTLIDIWAYQVGEVAEVPILRHFFNKQPHLNPMALWTMLGGVQFGDVGTARGETEPGPGSAGNTASTTVLEINDFEPTIWGLTGFDDPLFLFQDVSAEGTEGTMLNIQHRAIIDPGLPGLKVISSHGTEPFSERPVVLWNRIATADSQLIRVELGVPLEAGFSPFDVLVHAPIDHFDGAYMNVTRIGTISGLNFVGVHGVNFKDIPSSGTVRIISKNGDRNKIWRYSHKIMFPSADVNSIALAGAAPDDAPFPGAVGDVLELLPREYDSPCVRLQFSTEPSTGAILLQFKVGMLDMTLPYEQEIPGEDIAQFVRGLRGGYAVSAVYEQVAPWSGVGTPPESNFQNFNIINGGTGSDGEEHWNVLEIMMRGGQIWVWWNQLLIPPNTLLSDSLDTPVAITTPYFTAPLPQNTYGKFGVRMWPGATLRRAELRSQPRLYSELTYGQLELK